MKKCTLCPRNCMTDRANGETGVCGQTKQLKVARAALHYWEEPCISGKGGSGAVFFSGCALHCVFCQNHNIANGTAGKPISQERLCEIFLELQEKGANNINLVTPGHFVPQIIPALKRCQTDLLRLEKEGCADEFSCVRGISVDAVVHEVESGMSRRVEVVRLEEKAVRPLNPVTARIFSLAQKQAFTVG